MESWVERALQSRWPEWSYEETIKAKLLFLDYLGQALAKRDDEEGRRLAEHLESYGGEEQATMFAGTIMVPAPQAAMGNAMLTSAPLLFPVVLAAIEQQNKGGKELLSALITGLEATYRMGDHPQAELLGAMLGVANAFELDEEGWQVLLGFTLHNHKTVPLTGMGRGLLAHDLVLGGSLACDEWSEMFVDRDQMPSDWLEALQRTSGKPGMTDFLMATEVNADEAVAKFAAQVKGMIPDPHVRYYEDAVMGLEDVCCIPQFFRR